MINEQQIRCIKENIYNIGDKVLLYDPTTKIGLSRKLTIRWKGPYTIIQKRSDINYIIDIDGKMSLVNKQRLRPYIQNGNDQIKYDDNISLLKEEVDRINELELELRIQKQYKQQQLAIATATKQVLPTADINVLKNIDVMHEVIDEQESDIYVNACIVNMQW